MCKYEGRVLAFEDQKITKAQDGKQDVRKVGKAVLLTWGHANQIQHLADQQWLVLYQQYASELQFTNEDRFKYHQLSSLV